MGTLPSKPPDAGMVGMLGLEIDDQLKGDDAVIAYRRKYKHAGIHREVKSGFQVGKNIGVEEKAGFSIQVILVYEAYMQAPVQWQFVGQWLLEGYRDRITQILIRIAISIHFEGGFEPIE